MVGKDQFSQLFSIGEVIESGADPNRKNAAFLKILSIEEEFVRYQSIRSRNKSRMPYSYLQLLVDHFDEIDPKSIQSSVNRILKMAGMKSDYTTENYTYSFAKAFCMRMDGEVFLTEGESQPEGELSEGDRIAVYVDRIERNPKARRICISHFGAYCQACLFDFERAYGSIGRGFIHVHHHRQQLANVLGKHIVDPVNDLIPLCPNCHAMVHSRKDMLSIDELRKVIADTAGQEPKCPG